MLIVRTIFSHNSDLNEELIHILFINEAAGFS